jgi:hypothetical protein
MRTKEGINKLLLFSPTDCTNLHGLFVLIFGLETNYKRALILLPIFEKMRNIKMKAKWAKK